MSNIRRDKGEGKQHHILTTQHTVQHFYYSALLKVVKCQLWRKEIRLAFVTLEAVICLAGIHTEALA